MKREVPHLSVTVNAEPEFAPAPTPFQRQRVLDQALAEFVEDLQHCDRVVRTFVPGSEHPAISQDWASAEAKCDDDELIISGQQVMQSWERPLMQALAEEATTTHGDVLEVGFGMAISATMIQELGARSYTVLESNDQVISRFEKWKESYPGRDLRVVRGRWQDTIEGLGKFDGILFDTEPMIADEWERAVFGPPYAFAAEFFAAAAAHLKPGGIFTYYTSEIDTLSRGHQRLLLAHFDRFTVRRVRGLKPPVGCQYWWADSMVVVTATKG